VSEGDQLQKIHLFASLINKLGTAVLGPRCNAQAPGGQSWDWPYGLLLCIFRL